MRSRLIHIVSAILAILLVQIPSFAALASATEFTGKVVGITDGDTIIVLHNGRGEKIRLNAIDCPDRLESVQNRGLPNSLSVKR
jgi:endonuclease YncB( thermonuclease family)